MGESSRGCYNRNKQHVEAYKNKQGFMWDHSLNEHEGREDLTFEMELHARDRDPMRRIIRESVRIRTAKKGTADGVRDKSGKVIQLMNRKDEWFGVKTIQVHLIFVSLESILLFYLDTIL